jgi:hypothetical protein
MRGVLRIGTLVAVIAVAALLAATVSAADGTARASSAVQPNTETGGTVNVTVVIDRFVRQGRHIVAQGAVVARYTSATTAPTVVRKAYTARLVTKRGVSLSSTQRICDVLSLSLGPLHLNVLGLVVDLDRLVLTIKADSEGGLLGSLFCSLASRGTASPAKLRGIAKRMTRVARAKGLNQGVAGFQLQVAPKVSQVGEVCEILDLVLGPLDLNVLGLMIHLDQLHLRITAVRGGGLLGDLLCGLAGGGSPARTPSVRAGPAG